VQDHIEQRFMNPDATVVFDKAEVAKAVHEEADAGPSGADHFRQVIAGINDSGSPGLPNSASNKRVLAKRFSLELKS